VTDRTTPELDPVEDRLRRTFAARAEDMAPGDTAGTWADLGHDDHRAPHRVRGSRRPLLAAAAAVVVVVATAGVAVMSRGGEREPRGLTTVTEQPSADEAALAAVTAPRAVLAALGNERDLAAFTLIGAENAMDLPVTDTAQARRNTDAAIATFADIVAAAPDGAAYQAGLDGLVAVGQLRTDVDAQTGPRTMANIDSAQAVFDRYTALLDGVLNGQQAYAQTIDDPVVRTGAIAYGQGLRLGDQTRQLLQASLVVVVQPDPESVAELSRLHTEVTLGLDAVVVETAGTLFADAAVTVVGQVEETGLLGEVASYAAGNGNLAAIAGSASTLGNERWPAFLDSVEETLAAGG